MTANTIRNKVFISYSHKDIEWFERIKTTLRPLERQNPFLIWDDQKIEAGDKWKEEIANALETAKVAILLVSPNFLASDFIVEHELPPILDAAAKEGLKIVWVLISYCVYNPEIAAYQAINDSLEQPFDDLTNSKQNRLLVKLFRIVENSLQESLHPSLPDQDKELGLAISGIIQAAPSPYGTRGILRRYEKGSIYCIVEHGKPKLKWLQIKNNSAFRVNESFIGKKYEITGGTGSTLGFPLSEINKAWDNNFRENIVFSGYFQWFEGGVIYEAERFGAHVIYGGEIYKKFVDYEKWMKEKNREMTGGILGFPTSDEHEVLSHTGAKGVVQCFIYGCLIHWGGETFSIDQGFYDLYQSIGKWNGQLGFPLENEEKFISAESKGVIQRFENGCMQWNHDNNKGSYIYGSIYKRWEEEQENLGFALNSALPGKNCLMQRFEGGTIEENADGSIFVSYK